MLRIGDVLATLVVLLCRSGLSLVTSLALLAVAPALLGMTSTVVMSDSMAPGILAGDVVVVRSIPTKDVHVGQVLLVDDPSFPGRLRLHRLAQREHGDLLLKGDANAQADPTPVTPAAVHGVGFLRVPWIGLPLFWLRTGDPLLAAAAIAAISMAALLLTVLDDTGGRTVLRVGRRLGHFVVRSRRGRLVWFGLIGVVIASPTVHAHLDLGPASWARFTSTSTSPTNAFAAGTWCPALPKAVITGATVATAPDIAYSFNVSGTTETSVGALGAGYSSTLSTTTLRNAGTCTPGASPNVKFTGGESIVSTTAYPASASATQSIWFDASSPTGVLLDLGGTTAVAASAERQLYFTSGGGLAFAVRNGSSPITCTVATSVTTDTWHFAAVVYNSTAKSFTLYYDGQSTSCTATFTTAPSASLTLRGRIGNDATLASDAAGGTYAGLIDEVYTWGATMPAASIGTVYAGGH